MEKGSVSSINWGILAVQGALTQLFGIFVLIDYPTETVYIRELLFASYAILFGTYSIWAAIGYRVNWLAVIEWAEGLASILIGGAVFLLPHTDLSLITLVGIWAICIGVLKMLLSYAWCCGIPYNWLPNVTGIMSIILGIFLIIQHPTQMPAMSLYIGIYAIITGFLFFIFSHNLKNLQDAVTNK